MDRWFASPDLLEWLDGEHVGFVVRLRADTPLGAPWVEPHLHTSAGEVSLKDAPVTYHGNAWRLVRSDLKPTMKVPPGKREAEPWFLLTNIPVGRLSRQRVLNTYAKRFEIEEHFKDVKWIEGYEWHRIRKTTVAATVFMFVFLGWWLLLKACRPAGINQQPTRQTHAKKRLSWFRAIWEYWERQRLRPLRLAG